MRIAIVGCGFVSDHYLMTHTNHPILELTGVMDLQQERAARVASHYSVTHYRSLDELLADDSVDTVLNLTNPRAHFEVSKACLERGKHVYSEKPLTMRFDEAKQLVNMAEERGLHISGAPCNLLGESAQSFWKALRDNEIGNPVLAYVELDCGMVHRSRYRHWKNKFGVPWPWKDEFEVGITLEHAAYYVSLLTAFFGPAKTVTAFSSCLIPDKGTDEPLEVDGDDFSTACIRFESGVVARLTNSGVAKRRHELVVHGEGGILSSSDVWYYNAPVYIERPTRLPMRLDQYPVVKKLLGVGPRKYPLVKKSRFRHFHVGNQMDFCRGVAEMAEAIAEQRPSRLSTEYVLHVTEVVAAIEDPEGMGTPRTIETSFSPIDPMPWAKP